MTPHYHNDSNYEYSVRIEHVDEYPTMHCVGNPRSIQSMIAPLNCTIILLYLLYYYTIVLLTINGRIQWIAHMTLTEYFLKFQ